MASLLNLLLILSIILMLSGGVLCLYDIVTGEK